MLGLDGHALRVVRSVRVVASPAAIDAARWVPIEADEAQVILRVAPDEAIGVLMWEVEVDDPDAIIEVENGFVMGWCHQLGLDDHVEWPIPDVPGTLAQGSVAGVPAKIWIADEEEILLITHAAYAAELAERLGWDR